MLSLGRALSGLLLLLHPLLFACDPGADSPTYSALPDDLAASFEAERVSLGATGLAVAIQVGDDVYAQGFGARVPGTEDDLVGPSTLFRIGSVTKMMTATAVLRSVEAGSLALTDRVSDRFSNWSVPLTAEWSQAITVRDLLTHQGAFVDATPITDLVEDEGLQQWVTQDLTDLYLMAPPGTFYNYANPNFAVAGALVEVARGTGFYPQIMHDEVFAPLGMDRTYFHADDVLSDGDYAVAMTEGLTGFPQQVTPDTYDHAGMRPAGFAWCSALDLNRFAQFLLHGNERILSDALRAELTKEQVNTLEVEDYFHYGFGVSIARVLGGFEGVYTVPVWAHDGAIPGFSAGLMILPESEVAVVVLASRDGAYFGESIARTLESLAPDLPTPEADLALNLDEDMLGDFVGTYQDDFNAGEIQISQVGSELQMVAPDLDAASVPYDATMTRVSSRSFLWEVQGYPLLVTFVPGEAGDSQYLRTRVVVAERVTAIRASDVRGVVVDAEAFARKVRRASIEDRHVVSTLRRRLR